MSKSYQEAVKLAPSELRQFKFLIQQRQSAKDVMEQAQIQMNAAQDLWRVASGGFDSFVQFITAEYELGVGQFNIDPETGVIKNAQAPLKVEEPELNGVS
jgi:hypothetical protein